MPAFRPLASLILVSACIAPVPASALDDFDRAFSRGPTELRLCGKDSDLSTSGDCKKANYDALTRKIEKSLQAALARAPANVRPLLKRDQAWFNEMMLQTAQVLPQADEESDAREEYVKALRQRAETLDGVAQGFGRGGVAGRWVNAFGSITVTPADGGYRLAADLMSVYGLGSERRRECKIEADVKPAASAWFIGTIPPSGARTADGKSEPPKPVTVKLRRQGESLRVVLAGDAEWLDEDHADCNYMWQITGSYFADGKADAKAAGDKTEVAFVAPTFDCAKPESATDEEICADAELAENDQKLNRAWKALLPRLDEATRRTLAEDQRNWVKSQIQQYPQFLHPAWEKTTSFVHFTVDARDKLDRLQRERIALLDGFDETRTGFVGVWLAHNAILKVTETGDGGIETKGWKWDQGDWKAGCDFEMKGKLVGGTFVSNEKRKNPDTLERDHASLVVNRLDDTFAPKRTGNDGGDEPKCRRSYQNSSTVRLFPAKPSPDINDFGGSIR
jgi:uncharacterized protein YecT (DUF1311 family)